jgi:alpha-beta hydrolase superfamily lysophospholipase
MTYCCVTFSHGWPLSSDAWDRQMLFLAQNGFRVVAHDRRGHGRRAMTIRGMTWTDIRNEDNNKESKEPDDDDDEKSDKVGEEKQERDTGEITMTPTTNVLTLGTVCSYAEISIRILVFRPL